jgi:hypothetical protein
MTGMMKLLWLFSCAALARDASDHDSGPSRTSCRVCLEMVGRIDRSNSFWLYGYSKVEERSG